MRLLWSTLIVALLPSGVVALELDRQQVADFVAYMAAEHGFPSDQLQGTFAQAIGEERILEAMARPAESKPWHAYRPIFITEQRIAEGVAFWNANAQAIDRASVRYGVDPQVIVAIIGVETFYGRQTGSYRVLDALATLAFHYPQRAAFFRAELEQFLLLAREEGVDPLSLKGSYAGAMGMPQFISSSFRHYAVDLDGDGRRDIWGNVDDVVGSVANYLSVHGWQAGAQIAVPVEVDPALVPPLLERGLEPHTPVAELQAQGISGPMDAAATTLAALLSLEQADHREYWLAFHNFYVITRYNRSPLYAMAVKQLADEISARRATPGA